MSKIMVYTKNKIMRLPKLTDQSKRWYTDRIAREPTLSAALKAAYLQHYKNEQHAIDRLVKYIRSRNQVYNQTQLESLMDAFRRQVAKDMTPAQRAHINRLVARKKQAKSKWLAFLNKPATSVGP
jgi:hypothetical protein